MKINNQNKFTESIKNEQLESNPDIPKAPSLSLIDLVSRTYNVGFRLTERVSQSFPELTKLLTFAAGQLDL